MALFLSQSAKSSLALLIALPEVETAVERYVIQLFTATQMDFVLGALSVYTRSGATLGIRMGIRRN